jgi:glycosyltransferase involved in cell wall biosynthesis
MKVMQILAGDTHGGAENFFMRLVPALTEVGLNQYVVIKNHESRENILKQHEISYTTASFNKIFSSITTLKIQSTIHTFQPDIVVTWMSRASHLCPKGQFVHVGRLGGYYDLKYYQKCDHLIGNTIDIVGYFIDKQWPQEFTHYLPNFVDIPFTQATIERSQFNTPEAAPLLLTLGRLHDDKAFDVLIKAMSLIPKAYLWIGGVGEEKDKLVQLAHAHHVQDRIKFIGWFEDVTQLYNTCDIYLCPSRIEPLGNVILEAWAHQKPIVAAKSKGPMGLILHDKSGLLYEIEEWEQLAYTINRLLENPSLKEKIVKNGFMELNQKFTKSIVVQKYLTFFETILKKKRQ